MEQCLKLKEQDDAVVKDGLQTLATLEREYTARLEAAELKRGEAEQELARVETEHKKEMHAQNERVAELNEMLTKLRSDISRLTKDGKTAADELDALKNTCAMLTAERDTVRTEKAELQGMLEAAAQTHAKDLAVAKLEIEQLKAQMAANDKAYADQRTKADAAHKEDNDRLRASAELAVTNHASQIRGLEQQAATMTLTNKGLVEENLKLQQAHQADRVDLSSLKESLAVAQKQATAAQEQLTSQEAQIEVAQNQLKVADADAKSAQEQIEKLAATTKEHEAAAVASTAVAKEQAEKLEKLESDLTNMEEQGAAAASTHGERAGKLEEKLTAEKEKAKMAAKELKAKKAEVTKLNRLQKAEEKKIAKLAATAEALEAGKRESDEALAAAQVQIEQLTTAQTASDSTDREAYEALKIEHSSLKSNFESVQRTYEHANQELREQIGQKEQEVTTAAAKSQSIEQELEEARALAQHAEDSKAAAVQTAMSEASAQVSRMREEITSLQVQLASVESKQAQPVAAAAPTTASRFSVTVGSVSAKPMPMPMPPSASSLNVPTTTAKRMLSPPLRDAATSREKLPKAHSGPIGAAPGALDSVARKSSVGTPRVAASTIGSTPKSTVRGRSALSARNVNVGSAKRARALKKSAQSKSMSTPKPRSGPNASKSAQHSSKKRSAYSRKLASSTPRVQRSSAFEFVDDADSKSSLTFKKPARRDASSLPPHGSKKRPLFSSQGYESDKGNQSDAADVFG